MQIHYCYTCNKRVDSDDTVTVGDKVYCRACSAKLPPDELPLGRATPARGQQRRTPAGKPTATPGRGSTQISPARSSKTGIRPASPARGVSTRPGVTRASGGNAIPQRASGGHPLPQRASGGNPIPPRTSSAHIAPVRRQSGEYSQKDLNPRAAEPAAAAVEVRRPRKNNTLIWVLAGVALLLAGVGALLLVGGSTLPPPSPIVTPSK